MGSSVRAVGDRKTHTHTHTHTHDFTPSFFRMECMRVSYCRPLGCNRIIYMTRPHQCILITGIQLHAGVRQKWYFMHPSWPRLSPRLTVNVYDEASNSTVYEGLRVLWLQAASIILLVCRDLCMYVFVGSMHKCDITWYRSPPSCKSKNRSS